VSLGFAVMSLFINNGDRDDAFYVNRATATAQLNRIPVRDVLFTDERVPPIGGSGTPLDTLHALQGALGRVLGVHGASIAYYVTPPIATFLATWALWRLLRAWAPRRALLCFAVGCQYWLWSALLDLNPGSFFLARIWQGKVIFVAWLVPTLYVLLTRWLSRRDAVTAVLLFAAGLASIGLSGSTTLVAPLVFATAGLALAASREWRALAVVAGAAAIPFGIGFVATRRYPLPHLFASGLHGNQWFFDHVFGVGVVGALGVAALCIAPWIARAGPPARMTTAVAVIALLLLAPGVLPGLSDALELTDTLRRTLWIVPLPALVGLLVALPVRGLAAAGAAVALAAALVVFGQPLWQPRGGRPSYWTSRPEWKTNQARLHEARTILGRYHGSGAILASQGVMFAIAIQTSHPKAVDARHYYAQLLPEPRAWTSARRVLNEFATTGERVPGPSIEHALSVLGVGLVCVDADGVREMRRLGLNDRYRRAFRVDEMVCLQRA
jgi:MFS family permease